MREKKKCDGEGRFRRSRRAGKLRPLAESKCVEWREKKIGMDIKQLS